jgi:hypothetical protein
LFFLGQKQKIQKDWKNETTTTVMVLQLICCPLPC